MVAVIPPEPFRQRPWQTLALGCHERLRCPEIVMHIHPHRVPSDVAIAVPCPACGSRLGARAGCQAAFDALNAGSWASPARGTVHNLVVDAYCLQHPEDYCRSAKSYAAHLVGLCCGLEGGGDPQLYWTVARWLDGPRDLAKPAVLTDRGTLTVAHVTDVVDDADYTAGVRQWARAVWEAYETQHPVARAWLRAAAEARG